MMVIDTILQQNMKCRNEMILTKNRAHGQKMKQHRKGPELSYLRNISVKMVLEFKNGTRRPLCSFAEPSSALCKIMWVCTLYVGFRFAQKLPAACLPAGGARLCRLACRRSRRRRANLAPPGGVSM